MIETLIIGIVALALLKRRKPSGVGKVPKRRIFTEIATAQKRGIDFSMPFDEADSKVLSELAQRVGFRPSARSAKSTAEQYFNSLRRTYNAVSGIGATNLPYRESEVRNANGDVIITYRDYGTPEQQLRDAYTMIEEMPITDANSAYWHALLYIARGGKLVWKTKKAKDGQVLSRGAGDVLKFSEKERKARISYLGSEANGAMTLDQLTHHLWQSSDGYSRDTDDGEIYNGVEQAVLSCQSRKQAQREILDLYLSGHQIPEEDPDAVFDESMNDDRFAQINNDINDIIANYPSGNGSRAAMIYKNVLIKYGSLSDEWLESIGVKTYTDLEKWADNYDGNQQYNHDMPF